MVSLSGMHFFDVTSILAVWCHRAQPVAAAR
jgi:hypothetical protein